MKKGIITIRCLVFLLALCLISVSIYKVLAWKDSRGIDGLYLTPVNSVDVLFVGSSHSYCTINTAVLWKEYGITANDISESGQIFTTEYYYLREALKTQRPAVVFAEIRGIDMPYNLNDGNLYRNTINLKWSMDYFRNVDTAIMGLRNEDRQFESIEEVKKGMQLKFPVVHTRYNELSRNDFHINSKLLRYSPNWSRREYSMPSALRKTDVAELTFAQRNTLEQLGILSEEYGFELVLWCAPYVVNDSLMMEFNGVEQYAKEKGIDCYNIQEVIQGSGFDFSEDMREEKYYGSHINCYGAEKVTRYIGNLLKYKYGISDHRDDPQYKWFDLMAREWEAECATHALDTAKNFQDYASALDHTLFEATVIDYDKHNVNKQDDNTGIDSKNYIEQADSFSDWFVSRQEYVTYPEPGTVRFSASGLTELSYSRIEWPINLKTTDIIDGEEYVLSFEVMSPDWSAVSEPTTSYAGLDAVAVTFVTANDSPMGKQMAYRFLRLGKAKSSLWREVPIATNGEWLEYVSVPLKFTSTKATWSELDKGIGQYLRIGPTLRANGTVYFRNFKLEKANQSNDWAATLNYIIHEINDKQSDAKGLYTEGSRNKINGVWELSSQVKLSVNEEDLLQNKLYNGSTEIPIKECDVCVIVTDKENGNFIRKNEFTLSDGILVKN